MGRYRKSVFVVTYSISKKEIYYLILKRKLHWKGWEFPKGGVEEKENLYNAVKREIYEETGKKTIRIKKYSLKGRYKYKRRYPDRPGFIGQEYVLFSAQIKKGEIKIDKKEHVKYLWLKFDDALRKLRWRNQKKCLKIVNDYLVKTFININ